MTADVPPAPRPSYWVGTSWKMTKSFAEALRFTDHIRQGARPPAEVGMFVLPSFTLIQTVATALAGTGVRVGAQNAHWAPAGAFTGEVSVAMVAEAGAELVEVGHSERRASFGETDETVARKVAAVLGADLTPLVCVGEPASERDFGTAVEFVLRQVKIALSGVAPADLGRVLLAYEPVWAIGVEGTPATPEQVADMHAAIRGGLVERYGDYGWLPPLLYGGSVDRGNAAELLAQGNVDGLFVGRAAWDPDGFLALVDVAAGLAATARP